MRWVVDLFDSFLGLALLALAVFGPAAWAILYHWPNHLVGKALILACVGTLFLESSEYRYATAWQEAKGDKWRRRWCVRVLLFVVPLNFAVLYMPALGIAQAFAPMPPLTVPAPPAAGETYDPDGPRIGALEAVTLINFDLKWRMGEYETLAPENVARLAADAQGVRTIQALITEKGVTLAGGWDGAAGPNTRIAVRAARSVVAREMRELKRLRLEAVIQGVKVVGYLVLVGLFLLPVNIMKLIGKPLLFGRDALARLRTGPQDPVQAVMSAGRTVVRMVKREPPPAPVTYPPLSKVSSANDNDLGVWLITDAEGLVHRVPAWDGDGAKPALPAGWHWKSAEHAQSKNQRRAHPALNPQAKRRLYLARLAAQKAAQSNGEALTAAANA